MSDLHIFTAPLQPATKYRVEFEEGWGHTFRNRKRRTIWTSCCNRRRWAENLYIQVYYDELVFSCRPGKGCKAKGK
jgi:hypothetical protein